MTVPRSCKFTNGHSKNDISSDIVARGHSNDISSEIVLISHFLHSLNVRGAVLHEILHQVYVAERGKLRCTQWSHF